MILWVLLAKSLSIDERMGTFCGETATEGQGEMWDVLDAKENRVEGSCRRASAHTCLKNEDIRSSCRVKFPMRRNKG